MKTPVIPSVDIWSLLFDRPHLPFPTDRAIFRSATTKKLRTYQDVKQQGASFGSALQSSWKWQKGDVLIVMAVNHIDTPAVIWGCHYAGGTVCPVNPTLSAKELHQQLEGSQARGLVVHSSCLSVALEGARLAGLPKDRILILDESNTETLGVSSVPQFVTSTEGKNSGIRERVPINPREDVAFLVYSSGTTGRPKGVMISHRNVVASIAMQSAVDGDNLNWHDSRSLAVLPVYHIYGLICLIHLPMYLGITTTLMEKFDLKSFCRLVQDHSISHAYVAPPVVLHLTNSPVVDKYDMNSLRMLTSGGAPLAANLIKELFNSRGIPVRQAYGLSETTATSHIQRWDLWHSGTGSNGPPLPGIEIKFVKPDGTAGSVGEQGELWIRGPTVFNGYRNEPEITADCITEEGWFKTGDIGYEDETSNMFITDRAKDLIKFKGYQVAPAELEDLLIEHEAVDDAAVVGVMNHDLASEVPLAYIVLKTGTKDELATAQSILKFVQSRTLNYKQLRGGIVFTPEIPKGASGKILKRVLRERATGVDKTRRLGAVDYGKNKIQRGSKL